MLAANMKNNDVEIECNGVYPCHKIEKLMSIRTFQFLRWRLLGPSYFHMKVAQRIHMIICITTVTVEVEV